MESSKQTNETNNCVLETMTLEEFSRKTLNEKINKLIYEGYQPVFNTYQEQQFSSTDDYKIHTIFMAKYGTQDTLDTLIKIYNSIPSIHKQKRRKKKEEGGIRCDAQK